MAHSLHSLPPLLSEEAPPYIALSYAQAWGDGSDSKLILVDSDTVSVTRNLLHALLRLRPERGDEDLGGCG